VTIPIWTLVGFALWTLLLLFSTVGVYRWSRIRTGRVPISEFRADHIEGEDWYRRAMRAHASGVGGATVDALCIGILAARFAQSRIHVSLVQTNAVVSVRFAFFFLQIVGFLWLTAILIGRAA
jgi:hypothetical protein